MKGAGGSCGEPRAFVIPAAESCLGAGLWDRMAQELSEKELLKMEVEQLKKEVKNPRALVSLLLPSLPLFSIISWSSPSRDPKGKGQALRVVGLSRLAEGA